VHPDVGGLFAINRRCDDNSCATSAAVHDCRANGVTPRGGLRFTGRPKITAPKARSSTSIQESIVWRICRVLAVWRYAAKGRRSTPICRSTYYSLTDSESTNRVKLGSSGVDQCVRDRVRHPRCGCRVLQRSRSCRSRGLVGRWSRLAHLYSLRERIDLVCSSGRGPAVCVAVQTPGRRRTGWYRGRTATAAIIILLVALWSEGPRQVASAALIGARAFVVVGPGLIVAFVIRRLQRSEHA
jgi:hypothetical protein